MSGSNVFFSDELYASQTFTSGGTFNVPDGVNLVFIEMWGGGGGGADTSASNQTANGGGKSTAYVGQVAVTSGGSVSVSIGAGGIAGASGDGGDGVDSQFGVIFSRGGRGGILSASYSPSTTSLTGGDSFRAVGGSGVDNGGSSQIFTGGTGGYSNGGNGVSGGTGTNGGIGAGGGGGSTGGGVGGVGRCIVHWAKIS